MDNFRDMMLGLLIGAVIMLIMLASALPPTIPHCYEDEAIVGIGQFEDGYWTHYRCVPLDDL